MGDLLSEIADMIQRDNDVYYKFKVEKIIPIDYDSKYEKRYLLISKEAKYLLTESIMDFSGRRTLQYYYCKDELCNLDLNFPKFLHKNCQKNESGETKAFAVYTYIEGEKLSDYIAKVNDEDAYNLGVQIGKMIKKLHSVQFDAYKLHIGPWEQRYRYINSYIVKNYKSNPLIDKVFDFYKDNYSLLDNYKSTNLYKYVDGHAKQRSLVAFTDGEIKPDNIVVENGKLGIRSISELLITDPFYDFKFISLFAFINEYLATGIIDGYSDEEMPEFFFKMLRYYTCEYILEEFGKSLDESKIKKILEYYDGLSLEIPKWYKKK